MNCVTASKKALCENKVFSVFAVKTEILRELLEDVEWNKKLIEAETFSEATEVLVAYCKLKKYRVKEVCPTCGTIIIVKPFAVYCKNCGYARKFKKGHEGAY